MLSLKPRSLKTLGKKFGEWNVDLPADVAMIEHQTWRMLLKYFVRGITKPYMTANVNCHLLQATRSLAWLLLCFQCAIYTLEKKLNLGIGLTITTACTRKIVQVELWTYFATKICLVSTLSRVWHVWHYLSNISRNQVFYSFCFVNLGKGLELTQLVPLQKVLFALTNLKFLLV